MMHPRLNSLDCPAHRQIMNPEMIRYLFHDKGAGILSEEVEP